MKKEKTMHQKNECKTRVMNNYICIEVTICCVVYLLQIFYICTYVTNMFLNMCVACALAEFIQLSFVICYYCVYCC